MASWLLLRDYDLRAHQVINLLSTIGTNVYLDPEAGRTRQELGSRPPGEDPAGETGLNIRNTIALLSVDNKVGEKEFEFRKLYCLRTILETP